MIDDILQRRGVLKSRYWLNRLFSIGRQEENRLVSLFFIHHYLNNSDFLRITFSYYMIFN